ncbi:MAG: hypothetical protein K2Y21_12430 [Phycisphaerales bacterium]|nr:hypothetical protein [Phycisphaerales bacterium]
MPKPSQGQGVLAVLGVNEGKAAPSVGVDGDDGNSAVNGQRDDSVLAHLLASATHPKETTLPRKVRHAVVERSMRRTLTADPVSTTGRERADLRHENDSTKCAQVFGNKGVLSIRWLRVRFPSASLEEKAWFSRPFSIFEPRTLTAQSGIVSTVFAAVPESAPPLA